jgi:hypothetical protein
MDAVRHTEARLRNHCCSERKTSIAYSECVFVASGVQHVRVVRMHRTVICGLSGQMFF